jgi:hypothetical protein
MSLALILVVVCGGTLLLVLAVGWFLVWNKRSLARKQEQARARLQQEIARRGWRYEERADAYCALYNEGDGYIRATAAELLFSPRDVLDRAPEAVEAHDVLTGVHRGREFLAAAFKVRYIGTANLLRAVWVRTPAPGPALQVTQAVPLASRVNSVLAQSDLRTGDPDFDARFDVRSGDDRFARAVLAPPVTEFLKADPRQFRGFTLYGANLDFIDRVEDHLDPAALIPALDLRCDLLDRVPASVWAR